MQNKRKWVTTSSLYYGVSLKTGNHPRPPNIFSISQREDICPFSFFMIFRLFSYGISHLEKTGNRRYDVDTEKE